MFYLTIGFVKINFLLARLILNFGKLYEINISKFLNP